jgi:hypothetical protein
MSKKQGELSRVGIGHSDMMGWQFNCHPIIGIDHPTSASLPGMPTYGLIIHPIGIFRQKADFIPIPRETRKDGQARQGIQ